MTNDRFRELCEQVLLPYLGNFMHHQLIELHRAFDDLAGDVAIIRRHLDQIASQQTKHDGR